MFGFSDTTTTFTVSERLSELERRLDDLTRRLEDFIRLLEVPQAAPPRNTREGTLARADGTAWNPGSGAGLYQRRGSSWVRIG